MIICDMPPIDPIVIVKNVEFEIQQAQPAKSFSLTFELLPQDFIEAMNDFNFGNVVDLDIALNQKPSDEA